MAWHVGVIGTGQWSRVHLGALSASPHVERITLVGRNHEARQTLAAEFPRVDRTVDDLGKLLDDDSIELIHVVLPHYLHAETALRVLSAGKHVICEKPAAIRLEDFDTIVQAAAKNGRRLLVVMNQLYNPVAVRVRELVDEGALGRVFLSVENAFSNASRNYRDPAAWRTSVDRAGGGVLIDGGYHMVYRHLYGLSSYGLPDWVRADVAQLAVDPDGRHVPQKGEDFVAITVGYEKPLRIQWSHAWTLAAGVTRARQCFLAGTEGTLELTDEPHTPLVLHRADGSKNVHVEPGAQSSAETAHECLLDYVDCLVQGREPKRANLALARTALATILAAYESGRTGRQVEL